MSLKNSKKKAESPNLLDPLQNPLNDLINSLPNLLWLRTIRSQLLAIKNSGATISQVFVDATQIPGEPVLMGVQVLSVDLNFVVFIQPGSGGSTTITIRLDAIIGWEM
ncbi:hypothetical protein WD019_00655 [Fictibacillus sp. Mic-4]|uniref:hypothetical protein n=1 Tax=Fictibacillus sp. Mic-4 TaxID=3132826 RepID=UPI003CF15303